MIPKQYIKMLESPKKVSQLAHILDKKKFTLSIYAKMKSIYIEPKCKDKSVQKVRAHLVVRIKSIALL